MVDQRDSDISTTAVRNAADLTDRELLALLKPFVAYTLRLNHDLNNPLAGILGYGELLVAESDQLSPGQQECLEKMMEAAERMKDILESFCEEKRKLAEQIDVISLQEEEVRPA